MAKPFVKFRWRGLFLICGFCASAALVAIGGELLRTRGTGGLTPRRTPDTLVIATTHEPSTLHPAFGSEGMATVEVLATLFEPLTLYDDQHRLVPRLATEVPTLDNGGLRLLPDGKMESVWHLRPDAR